MVLKLKTGWREKLQGGTQGKGMEQTFSLQKGGAHAGDGDAECQKKKEGRPAKEKTGSGGGK